MSERLNLQNVVPDAYVAVSTLERHVRSKIDAGLLELVKLRASVLNGCARCVDLHATDALDAGEDVRRLFAVSAWRESTFFTPAERAALALADAVTRIGDAGVPDEVWDAAVAAFGPSTTAELVVAIATINVWNRLAVANRSAPPPR